MSSRLKANFKPPLEAVPFFSAIPFSRPISLPTEGVEYLVGGPSVVMSPQVPYHPSAIAFLNDLSSEILTRMDARRFPDLMTFAFWCRKSNLNTLASEFSTERVHMGLGLALHIAPANVPVNFAFSLAFGILSGNSNVVRVPSARFGQVDILCDAIRNVFGLAIHHEIASMNALVRYEANDALTTQFLSRCRARILWGGDDTVQRLRQLPAPAHLVDVSFPDRYSLCVIDSSAVLAVDAAEVAQLAEHFCHDAYAMDQMACSSPQLILWLGTSANKAQELFWKAVQKFADRRYSPSLIQTITKHTQFCRDAMDLESFGGLRRLGGSVFRARLTVLNDRLERLRGQFGYFYEYVADDLGVLTPLVSYKFQTLTYFGIPVHRLSEWVQSSRLTGIDRIVPIGSALNMGVVWDGMDLIARLSRIIDVKENHGNPTKTEAESELHTRYSRHP